MADTYPNSWKLLYEAGRQALQARKLQEAEQSFSAALQLAEDFAAGDPRLSATLNALARIYSLQRRYLAAAALLNRLLEFTERTLGPNHVQVAGVLTNLAEMYTHFGAAREELELRERVLAIRVDDPNADVAALQRLRERVTELRAALAAQEASDEINDEEIEPLPAVRTAEYSAPLASVEQPKVSGPAASSEIDERDDAYRPSPPTSELSVAPWPGAAATGTTPTDAHTVEPGLPTSHGDPASRYAGDAADESLAIVEQPAHGLRSATDHGFSDMGRDELVPIEQRFSTRTRLMSVAAGVVMVAGILSARGYVTGANDAPTSAAGSVSLANASVPTVPVAVTPPVPRPGETADPLSMVRLTPPQRAEREMTPPNDNGERTISNETRERAPRAPKIDLDRTLKGVDVAVRAIAQSTKAVTDSATAIRLQAPTFKKVKIAEP